MRQAGLTPAHHLFSPLFGTKLLLYDYGLRLASFLTSEISFLGNFPSCERRNFFHPPNPIPDPDSSPHKINRITLSTLFLTYRSTGVALALLPE